MIESTLLYPTNLEAERNLSTSCCNRCYGQPREGEEFAAKYGGETSSSHLQSIYIYANKASFDRKLAGIMRFPIPRLSKTYCR
jgi:hypothetical protein